MEDTQVGGSGSDGSVGAEGTVEAPQDNSSGGSPQEMAAADTDSQGQNAPGAEGESDAFVKDEDGNEYIPRKAFEERLAKLTQQKHDARTQVLESLRSDPTFKKEFMDSLNLGGESAASSQESNEPSPFEQFLAPLPKEHQEHYRGFGKAIGAEFTPFVQQEIQKALAPIMAHIGEEKLRTFSQTNKDFGKYQENVRKIMSDGRAKTLEDAYILASHEDRLKAVHNAGAKEEVERRKKMASAPFNRSAGGGKASGPSKFGLREALQKAGQELGYTG